MRYSRRVDIIDQKYNTNIMVDYIDPTETE